MAPKVCVPADFGRHHIGAPSHGNLTFNLGEGVQIKANSIILSLNSPVIDDLTTNLHLTSLEAENFSREAVDCFIEASYTGEIEAVTVGNFRDVNKMSRVFDFSWLVSRCEEYFVSYLDKLDSESSYPDILFAVEEAVYLMHVLKKRHFIDLAVKKMVSFSVQKRSSFIRQYLSDFTNSNVHQIHFSIDVMKSDHTHVLVGLLISHLAEGGNKCLDINSRLLFKGINMQDCFSKRPDLGEKLFNVIEKLEDINREDAQLFLGLYKQKCVGMGIQNITIRRFPLKKNSNYTDELDTVLNDLTGNYTINCMYSLFEFLWCYIYEKGNDLDDFAVQSLCQKLIEMKNRYNWEKMGCNYMNKVRKSDSKIRKYVELVGNCKQIVSDSMNVVSTTICEYSSSEFVEQVLCKDNKFEFQILDKNCCLIIKSIKGDDPETFSMTLEMADSHRALSKDVSARFHWNGLLQSTVNG